MAVAAVTRLIQRNQTTTAVNNIVLRNPTANGLALIFSNEYVKTPHWDTLTGTTIDAESMKSTFECLNFAVHYNSNTTKKGLLDILHVVASYRKYPPSYRRIVVVFSGHGTINQQLITEEGETITVEEMLTAFYPENAPNLGGIPKLFFIDACRGDTGDPGVVVPKGCEDATLRVPHKGNFLIAYSTMPNYKSFEQKGKGGIWMTSLAAKLRDEDASVLDILTKVNEELMARFQLPGMQMCVQQPELHSCLNEEVNLWREAVQATTTVLGIDSAMEEDERGVGEKGKKEDELGLQQDADDWCIVSVSQSLPIAMPEMHPLRRQLSSPVTFPRSGTENVLSKTSPPKKSASSPQNTSPGSQQQKGQRSNVSTPACASPPKKSASSPQNTSPGSQQQRGQRSRASTPGNSPQQQNSTNVKDTSPSQGIQFQSQCSTAKQKIAIFCEENVKPEAKYRCTHLPGPGTKQFVADVYVAKTCGWVSGDPKPLRRQAEEDAATKLLQRLNI